MELGRHTELAVKRYQERGAVLADWARIRWHSAPDKAAYCQRCSATEYATARKLMNIEPEGTENV